MGESSKGSRSEQLREQHETVMGTNNPDVAQGEVRKLCERNGKDDGFDAKLDALRQRKKSGQLRLRGRGKTKPKS